MTRPLTGILALLSSFLLALLLAAPASAGDEGQEAFLQTKCNKCHTIESLGIETLVEEEEEEEEDEFDEEDEIDPPDLSDVGDNFESADEISQWLQKKLEREDRKHKAKFRGPKKDLKLITEWLMTLKAE